VDQYVSHRQTKLVKFGWGQVEQAWVHWTCATAQGLNYLNMYCSDSDPEN